MFVLKSRKVFQKKKVYVGAERRGCAKMCDGESARLGFFFCVCVCLCSPLFFALCA